MENSTRILIIVLETHPQPTFPIVSEENLCYFETHRIGLSLIKKLSRRNLGAEGEGRRKKCMDLHQALLFKALHRRENSFPLFGGSNAIFKPAVFKQEQKVISVRNRWIL